MDYEKVVGCFGDVMSNATWENHTRTNLEDLTSALTVTGNTTQCYVTSALSIRVSVASNAQA
jgi:hypothetical protein